MKGWGHSPRLQCLPGGSDNSEADTTRTRSTKGEDSSLGHIIFRSSTQLLLQLLEGLWKYKHAAAYSEGTPGSAHTNPFMHDTNFMYVIVYTCSKAMLQCQSSA